MRTPRTVAEITWCKRNKGSGVHYILFWLQRGRYGRKNTADEDVPQHIKRWQAWRQPAYMIMCRNAAPVVGKRA